MNVFCPICYRNLDIGEDYVLSHGLVPSNIVYTLECKKGHCYLNIIKETNFPIYYQFDIPQSNYLLISNNIKYDNKLPNSTWLYQEIISFNRSNDYKIISNRSNDYKIISIVPNFIPIDLTMPLPSQIDHITKRMLKIIIYI